LLDLHSVCRLVKQNTPISRGICVGGIGLEPTTSSV
jgi:hypothetical protein